jgi:hypothetical protein
MKAILLGLLLTCAGKEPSIVFDDRPEAGVPPEALAQKTDQGFGNETLHAMTQGTIKTIRIRYFNKKTWATEGQAREYVAGFLAHESQEVFGSHPKGDRKLSENPKKYTPPQFMGKWTVTFANGVVETCDVRANWTASESEPKRSADGKAELKDNVLVIRFADSRFERWTTVDKRVVVEHYFPGTEFPVGARVLGIADRVP